MTALLGWTLAAGVACAAMSSAFSRVMGNHCVGKHIREQGPRSHLMKEGTPTMGGVVVLLVWGGSLAALSWMGRGSPSCWIVYVASVLFGAIGLFDDLLSQRRHERVAPGSGMRPWQKIALGTIAWAVMIGLFPNLLRTEFIVPFASMVVQIPRWLTFPLTWLVFTGATNSMNLTDGLDGLATGIAAISMIGLVVSLPDSTSATSIVLLIGVLIGFLWSNSYPSRLFMGDVGSFALGGTLAVLAIDNGLVLFLPFFAAVPLLESLSVIAQVGLFRTTGLRLFRMAPLHHHFEETASPHRSFLVPAITLAEPRITMRFWIVHALFVFLGVLAVR
ncbi:phospho-N-acetylmuramoyl-pentapeptide-transferase [Candidatus Bipolaricaulota bacterium]|nr:phospho-N-acetylmuramoyl-pentapeptide-transferase [Candidatus Bipolaricaulota bacterium]